MRSQKRGLKVPIMKTRLTCLRISNQLPEIKKRKTWLSTVVVEAEIVLASGRAEAGLVIPSTKKACSK